MERSNKPLLRDDLAFANRPVFASILRCLDALYVVLSDYLDRQDGDMESMRNALDRRIDSMVVLRNKADGRIKP